MTKSIESFKQSHVSCSFYNMLCESNDILAKLFGDYLTWNTINKYKDICFDLDIGLSYHHEDIIYIY